MKKVKKVLLPSLFIIIVQLVVLTCNTPTETKAINTSTYNNANTLDSITVESIDGKTAISNVKRIRVSNGTLINEGNGIAKITTDGSTISNPSLKLITYTPPASQGSPYTISVPKPPVYVSAWSKRSNRSIQYGSGGISAPSIQGINDANIQYDHTTGKLTVYADPPNVYSGEISIYIVYFE